MFSESVLRIVLTDFCRTFQVLQTEERFHDRGAEGDHAGAQPIALLVRGRHCHRICHLSGPTGAQFRHSKGRIVTHVERKFYNINFITFMNRL